jgi:hypothetical protein
VADDDTDMDGTEDCDDECPSDPDKTSPGTCGCGEPESDTDGDTVLDCEDSCPIDATDAADCFGFIPSNVDPQSLDFASAPAAVLNCGVTTIDTAGSITISNWCGTAPVPVTQTQSGGPDLVVIRLQSLDLANGNTLRLIGPLPVAIVVDGAVTLGGVVDASANAATPGAGGDAMCGGSQGQDGDGDSSSGGGGGGGGGFGMSGGDGGDGDVDNKGAAGISRGVAANTPLIGGCGGGQGGGCSQSGGAGGGALQITARTALTVTGTVRSNGGAGVDGCGSEGGGSGGGSGGALLLEADAVTVTGATLQANGGNGGDGSNGGNGGMGSTSASSAGEAGEDDGSNGGGGGGGGYGRIHLAGATSCTDCQ